MSVQFVSRCIYFARSVTVMRYLGSNSHQVAGGRWVIVCCWPQPQLRVDNVLLTVVFARPITAVRGFTTCNPILMHVVSVTFDRYHLDGQYVILDC